jgi:hypothetical protein
MISAMKLGYGCYMTEVLDVAGFESDVSAGTGRGVSV